jgi:endonuclease/exonuclease/phosphatase family metal-dependent hydrolase
VEPSFNRSTVDSRGLAIESVSVAHDARRLLLAVRLDRSLTIQEENPLILAIDVDGKQETGCLVLGVGAEWSWRFGERRGSYCGPGNERSIQHQHLGLVTAPTHDSREFEIGVSLEPEGTTLRSANGPLTIVLGTEGQATARVSYAFERPAEERLETATLARAPSGPARFVSHNLNRRLFDPALAEPLERLYRAVDADLYLLQEIRRPTDEVVARLRRLHPALEGLELHAAAAGEDHRGNADVNVLVGPYPILASEALGGSGAFLLELGPSATDRLLVVALSLPCCHWHADRTHEIDTITQALTGARTGQGPLATHSSTPILLMGDANLVGSSEQLAALLGWSEPAMVDLLPLHLHGTDAFTWYGLGRSGYSPGRLDYVIADPRLEIRNSFILYTPVLPTELLSAFGLERLDSQASDHLPVVLDLALPPRER